MNWHWIFYNIGGFAAILSSVFAAVLVMWTLRNARRSAIYRCTVGLVICLAVTALCIVGMKLT